MIRFQLVAAGIVVSGVLGDWACARDGANTTTTTAAVIVPSTGIVRARVASSGLYHPERELISPDRAAERDTPTAAGVTVVDTSATPTATRAAPREGDSVAARSPVGPGGFAAAPLDTAGDFVPGSLDLARGFGPARVDPRRAFTPAPLDTSFSGPNLVDDVPSAGPMGPSGGSSPSTTGGAGPTR